MTEQQNAASASLGELLRFSAADLAANRAGQLSEGQRARLKSQFRRALAINSAIILFVVLAATTLIFFGSQNANTVLLLVGIALTIFNAGLMGVTAQTAMRYRADTSATPLLVQEGPAERILRVNPRTRSSAYIVRVGGSDIRAAKPVFNAFSEHSRYRVYRSAGSKQVLSVEAL
jgi:hypothetical protein